MLSKAATKAHVFEGLTNASLISVRQLCNDNCTAIFNKHDVQIMKDGAIIIKGICNMVDQLWDIKLPMKPLVLEPSVNVIIKRTHHIQS